MQPSGIDTGTTATATPAAPPAAPPAPAAAPAASPGAEPSYDGFLDSMFSGNGSGDTTGEPPPLENLGGETKPPEGETAAPPAETQPPTGETPPAEGDPAEETDPNALLEEDLDNLPKVPGKGFYVTAAKRDRLFGALRFQKAVEEVIPGVTPESVKDMAEYNVGARRLWNDLGGANVDGAVQFLLNHPNKQVGIGIVDAVMKRLPEVAPQLAQQMAATAIQDKIQEFYQSAMQSGNEQLFAVAQHLDRQINGKFQTREDFTPAPQTDPEVARLRQENEQFKQKQAQSSHARLRSFVAETDTLLETAANEAIEAALEPVASLKGKAEYQVMKSELRKAVDEAARLDSPWKRDFDLRYQQLQQTQDPQARTALVERVKALASQISRNKRGALIGQYGKGFLAKNKVAHEQAQTAAAKAEPGAGGAPPSRPDPLEGLKQAKSFDEGIDALFGQAT